MGYAVAAIIVVVSGVLSWLSFKSWRWANILLLFLVVCAAATFGYLAGYTLKVHSAWKTLALKQQTEIDKEDAQRLKHLEGAKDENGVLKGGLRQLTQEVHDLMVRRGPRWLEVQVARKPAADGTTEVSIEAPEPHGLAENSVLFAFDAEPFADGGRYLGEFVAAKAPADGKLITLVPNMPLTEAELKKLQSSKGGIWTLYLKMPSDENDVFKMLTKDQVDSIVPEDFPEGYREGTRKEEDMADYTFMFHEFSLQRGLAKDEMTKLISNTQRLTEAEERNQVKIKYGETEKADLTFDKQGFDAERQAVTTYRKTLDARAKKLEQDVATLRANNEKIAAEIKRLQLEAADAIYRQTETAQAAPAAKQ